MLSLWFCFLLHSILFFISQTSYRTYKIISSYELARPIMGTIFLVYIYIFITYLPPLTVHFSMTRSMRYQPILHTLYYTLHTEHAYCLSYRFLNNVVITTVIETVEMVEILDGRLGKRSVERVRYVINNLLHLVIVKYRDISLVLCISTRLRLVTILSLLMKYLVILHADPCNKSYIYHVKSRLNTPVWGSLHSPNYIYHAKS